MSALNFAIELAHDPHVVMIGFASWSDFVRLRRPWEERARAGWAIFIGSVVRGARRARDGVRSTAYCRAHPTDGSRPHSRARRTFLNGEKGGARAGMPTHMPAHARVHVRCQRRAQHSICAVAVRRQRALLVHPMAPSSGPPPPPLQCPRRTFVSQCLRGSEWVPRVPRACSVCALGRVLAVG